MQKIIKNLDFEQNDENPLLIVSDKTESVIGKPKLEKDYVGEIFVDQERDFMFLFIQR